MQSMYKISPFGFIILLLARFLGWLLVGWLEAGGTQHTTRHGDRGRHRYYGHGPTDARRPGPGANNNVYQIERTRTRNEAAGRRAWLPLTSSEREASTGAFSTVGCGLTRACWRRYAGGRIDIYIYIYIYRYIL